MLALGAWTYFKKGGSIRVDIGRKEQFIRVVADCHTVGKLHDGKTVVKDFECRFLSFPLEHVAHHKHRLPFPFCPEITQRMLRGGCAGELPA